jgi:hypothetical protein
VSGQYGCGFYRARASGQQGLEQFTVTKLESEVIRETSLTVRDRLVNVSLVPADPSRGVGDALEFHLKGTQQRKTVPLSVIADAIWPPAKKIEQATKALGFDLDYLEAALAPFKEAA